MKFHFDADMNSVHRRLAEKDENNIRLSPEAFKRFMEILERPAQVNEKLRALLTEPSVLEVQRGG